MQENNQDMIGYDEIIENSMRTVIYETLKKIEKNGLPGKHYFVISFLTNFPETKIPDSLKEKYTDEMTIVMQYQYKNLEVNQDEFVVSLSFAGKYKRLTIPYKAVTSFADPSMNFGLKFSVRYEDLEAAEISLVDTENSANSDEEDQKEGKKTTKGKSTKKTSAKKDSSKKSTDKSSKTKGKKSKKTDTSSKVVSLDEFRKEKNDNNEND